MTETTRKRREAKRKNRDRRLRRYLENDKNFPTIPLHEGLPERLRKSRRRQKRMKKSDILFGLAIIAAVLAGLFGLVSLQKTDGGRPHTEEPVYLTPTAEPTDGIEVVLIDEIPTARPVAEDTPTPTPKPTNTPTSAPTPTNTPTQTPTIAPTCTQKPTERISTPKPTKSPTPTQKPVKTENKAKAGYYRGTAGTYACEDGHTFKPYTRYTSYTNKASRQYKLQQKARTAENGIRVVTDPDGVERYCIALGTSWAGGTPADIGRCIDVKMRNGATLHCVLSDVKKVEHTKNQEGYFGGKNGEVLEFIVGKDSEIPEAIKRCGDVSKAGSEFVGGIKEIRVLEKYIDGFGG